MAATTRGIAREGSRRAPRCKEDDKETIKLPGGGCYHHPSSIFVARLSFLPTLSFVLYWEEDNFGSFSPGLRCPIGQGLESILDHVIYCL